MTATRIESSEDRLSMTKPATMEKNNGRRLSFGSLEVRTYERILDDDPDISMPLTLGWAYAQEESCPLFTEADNSVRSTTRSGSGFFRALAASDFPGYARPKTPQERFRILKKFGYSREEIRKAERERQQRFKSPRRRPGLFRMFSSRRKIKGSAQEQESNGNDNNTPVVANHSEGTKVGQQQQQQQ